MPAMAKGQTLGDESIFFDNYLDIYRSNGIPNLNFYKLYKKFKT